MNNIDNIKVVLSFHCATLRDIYLSRRVSRYWYEALVSHSKEVWLRMSPQTLKSHHYRDIIYEILSRGDTMLIECVLKYRVPYSYSGFMFGVLRSRPSWPYFALQRLLEQNVQCDEEDTNQELCQEACQSYLPFHIMKFFIDRCKVIRPDREWTPFRELLVNGTREVVEYLVAKGIDVVTNTKRVKPLRCAIYGGDLEVVKYLVEQGADINHTARRGIQPPVDQCTPLTSAIRHKHKDIEDYLRTLGAIEVPPRSNEWEDESIYDNEKARLLMAIKE